MLLSRDQILEYLNVNIDTGIITWKKLTCATSRAKIGDIAGSITRKGYRKVNLFGREYRIHNLIWLVANGRYPVNELDHKNRNKLDNRLANLRECTHQQNAYNKKANGVYWSGTKWIAQIGVNGEKVYLGSYVNKQDAINRYIGACKHYHKEFAA